MQLFLLIFGLLGPLLDFAENSYVWQMVSLLEHGDPSDQYVLGAWQAIRHLSYIVPFSAAVMLLSILYVQVSIGPVVAGVAVIATLIATIGLYLPALEPVSNLWWLLFFLLAAWVHWQAGDPETGIG